MYADGVLCKEKEGQVDAGKGCSRFYLKWIFYGGFVGILSGSASALFLALLDKATHARLEFPWLLFFLPVGGALISYVYLKLGKNAMKGNNLLIEQIQDGEEAVPLRMAPLVLLGTLTTPSVGRFCGKRRHSSANGRQFG